jgi:hypothetical protein
VDEHTAADKPEASLIRRIADEVVDQVRTLADALTSTGGSTLNALAPSMVSNLLSSLLRLAEQAPSPTAPLDMFVQEVRAKRALVVAMRIQLEAFEQELDILERSVQPLNDWGQQWTSVQASLVNSLQQIKPTPKSAGRRDSRHEQP